MKDKVLIVYSSRSTGNSKMIAEYLADKFSDKAVLSSAGDAPDPNKFAYVIVGFGIYRGWPDGDMRAFMQRCNSQKVGIFLTLGAYPDSDHAKNCMGRAEGLLQSCSVVGKFICHGKIDPELVERMKGRSSGPHSWNPEREERIGIAADHPDENDCSKAYEIFSAAFEKVQNPHASKKAVKKKKAILLVAFGSSYPEARQAYENIEKNVRSENPETEIFWAYTSRIVRKILEKRGEKFYSVCDALNNLYLDNYTDIKVISLHIVPGAEYHKLLSEAGVFRNSQLKFNNLEISSPLLANYAELKKVCNAVISAIPVERKSDEAVLLMGHGNHIGRGDMHYLATAAEFNKLDKNIYLACVEGVPDFDEIKNEFAKKSIKKVYLMPFMVVAGDHARNDLAGEEDSWKSDLEEAGIECVPILKGLGEYDSIAKLFAAKTGSICD